MQRTGEGEFQIISPTEETVEAIKVYHRGPTLWLKHQMLLPPRSLTVLKGVTTLTNKHKERYYEITPNPHLASEHPTLVMYPMLHHPNVCGEVKVPVCMINLATDPIRIKESRIIGLMKEEDVTEKEVTTGTAHESICEVEDINEASLFHEMKCKGKTHQGTFIVSPADITSREKPKLKDAEVSPEWRNRFETLFEQYSQVFSNSSANIGKTPIVQMDIDTGDNPPISQRPYSLALKHVEWVRQELEALEQAQIITRSVSPWASPIVIVP